MTKPSTDFFMFKSIDIPQYPIVYFLIQDNQVKYVGQTKKGIIHRLGKHIRVWRIDMIFYMPVPEDRLDEFERYYIQYYQPEFNRLGKGKCE